MIAARTFAQAGYLSVYEFFDIYSPAGYVLSFVPRIVLQLAFFYWVGEFVGGSELRTFMVVGNAAQMAVHTVLVFAAQGVGRELAGGTLILLLATPARVILVLIGRNLAMAANGVLTAAIGLGFALIVLGSPVDAPRLGGAVALLVVISLSSFGLAVVIGSVMLRLPQYQAVASNLIGISMLVLCGVTVPVDVLPAPLQALSMALPLTHGLEALRAVLAGAGPDRIMGAVGRELAVGVMYFVISYFAFVHFLRRARAKGTLDFH